jgi:hypothetical protein
MVSRLLDESAGCHPLMDTAKLPSVGTVREDVTWPVRLQKTPTQRFFGVKFVPTAYSSLRITHVMPGNLVDAWNLANPTKAVIPDDLIIQVNHVDGSSAELSAAMCSAEGVDIVVTRRGGQWPVTIERDETVKLGLDAEILRGRLMVRAVTGSRHSAFGAWNAAHPEDAVEPEDVITRVNGVADVAEDMLRELQKKEQKGQLRILVKRRGPWWTMPIIKTPGNNLGVAFKTMKDGTLIVEDVKEGGLVELFNARLEWDGGPMAARALRKGDEVLSVNGAIGGPVMIHEIKTRTYLQIVVLRELNLN